jgi:hypothetical protein
MTETKLPPPVIKTPQERDTMDLLSLTFELHGRSVQQRDNEKMHKFYVEARTELEKRIKNLIRYEKNLETGEPVISRKLNDWILDRGILSRLSCWDIHTVDDLAETTVEDLLRIRNMGRKSIIKLENLLMKFGLKFKKNEFLSAVNYEKQEPVISESQKLRKTHLIDLKLPLRLSSALQVYWHQNNPDFPYKDAQVHHLRFVKRSKIICYRNFHKKSLQYLDELCQKAEINMSP